MRSSMLPALWVGLSMTCVMKCSFARAYRSWIMHCSSLVAPLAQVPLVQRACGKLKSPHKRTSGMGEGRLFRTLWSSLRKSLNSLFPDLCLPSRSSGWRYTTITIKSRDLMCTPRDSTTPFEKEKIISLFIAASSLMYSATPPLSLECLFLFWRVRSCLNRV